VARQCIEAHLLDDIAIHVVPVLLGDGVRLFSRPKGELVHLELAGVSRAWQVTNLRFAVVG
jgi:dihydrofolate reductase